MTRIVSDRFDAIAALARKHGSPVCFFSAPRFPRFRSAAKRSRFLVEFAPGPPADRANRYFGLLEDLESLFGLPIDLVEPGPIQNPYFREEIEKTKYSLYEVA